MEPSKEPVSVRVARINSEITKKNTKPEKCLLARDTLLDAVQVLYDECSSQNLQKTDSNIARFVEKYNNDVKHIKHLRVNMSDFEIKNIIGRGHFGEVHVVKEKQTSDVYAMKTIRKFNADISKTSFDEERDIMAYSNSQWLTQLQYAFQDSNCLYFVMEYHSGGDLLGLLYRQGGTLPESAATFYIAELILALEDLHKMGYVHRDIKPDNILLDRCGHLKLADFGSAAKLNKDGFVNIGPPVGTPDYIAPEVLQSLDNKNDKNSGYGISCDFWSLGVLAFELTVGHPPFQGQSSTSVYSKIMNYTSTLQFPLDIALTQAYITFVKDLITDHKNRLSQKEIKNHQLFKNLHFENLREQVPPYVPKITSVDDTSNFNDVPVKKKVPSIENFKKRSQFSGRNLPFVGFTFTHDPDGFEVNFDRKAVVKNEQVESLKNEVENLRKKLLRSEDFGQEKDSMEKKLEEKSRKLESIEVLRDKLERDLAGSIADCTALRRTLELERKERSELEKKALDLIKSAKLKWETSEKNKVEALTLEIEQQKVKITQLTNTNKILDEQLQHALKMEGKHKQSLEHVHVLSRRSVIGLESRLEKVTSDTEVKISELQTKLSDETHQKMLLQNQVTKYKDHEIDLKEKLKTAEENYNHLKPRVEEAEFLVSQLTEKVKDLEQRMYDTDASYTKEIQDLQKKYEDGQKTIKDLENKNIVLQMEAKNLEECKDEMEDLKVKINKLQNDKRVSVLETRLFEEREKSAALKKRLEESENVITENQELKELRTKYWRMEKEFANCKIDKRILERELKEAQIEIKQLNETVDNLSKTFADSKKNHEAAILELGSMNESASMELTKMIERCKSLQELVKAEKDRNEEEKTVILELKQLIASKERTIEALHSELDDLLGEKNHVEARLRKTEEEKTKLMNVVENLQKEKAVVQNDLEKTRREMENSNLNLNALREACTLLESQVVEYEKINESFQHKQLELNANTEKLINDLCKAKQDIQEAKKQTNEEKSLKALAEAKIKRLQEDIQCLENENTSYKKQCMEYKEYSTSLSDELTAAEEKISELEVASKSYVRQIDDLVAERRVLKEDITEQLTQIAKLKESNYKLNRHLGDVSETNSELVQKIRELERVLNEKSNFYRERELKADATIKQQIKLIDYLQTKIDEYAHKKKTLTEVLFGSSKKENHPPVSLAKNYKDLETELLKERQNNKQLQEEVYKLKAATVADINCKVSEKISKVEKQRSEILSPQSKIAMSQLVSSPASQKTEMGRRNSSQRMRHKIPHRFESRICTRSTKCQQCSNQIPMGRSMSICTECNVTAHSTCSSALPHTCKLPTAFAKHYKESLEKLNVEQSAVQGQSKEFDSVVNVEGWIKVPGKSNGWEKRYATLTDTSINTYLEKPNIKLPTSPLESFVLKPENSHGKVILEPLPSEIGVAVANSDLPFIIKIEVAPDTTCWPAKCFIFMALTAKEKDQWYLALQKIFETDIDKSELELVTQVDTDLNVNCIMDLTENIKAIGTEKGLYSSFQQNLMHINGLSQVHHITIFTPANLVLMIVDSKSYLVSCDINHLINLTQCSPCVKPTLKFRRVNVNGLQGFHILQVSSIDSQTNVCVATTKQLIILEFCFETSEFVSVRVLDTAEPTGCLLFTENSLIVGADKFFEIDLNTFEAEEFLDASDSKLKMATTCYKIGSYPISIIEVSKNPKEYLLSFNEFSVFVDEYGRSSREVDIKNIHMPLSFHFAKHYLYVIQFAAVEVMNITDESFKDPSKDYQPIRINLDKFKYVGANSKGIYVYIKNCIKFLEARKFDPSDVSSLLSESHTETENDMDKFSFTSSMVHSLDGNLSDTEIGEDGSSKARKVKFSRTTDL